MHVFMLSYPFFVINVIYSTFVHTKILHIIRFFALDSIKKMTYLALFLLLLMLFIYVDTNFYLVSYYSFWSTLTYLTVHICCQ